MATTKERILVTLTPAMTQELRARAKHAKMPRATIAARLLEQAMDDLTDDEDRALSLLAERRMRATKRWLTHEEVWGKQRA